MSQKALAHFKKADPLLYSAYKNIKQLQVLKNRKGNDYFVDLIDAIVSQQLSGKASETIFNRLRTLFKNGKITPEGILKLKDEKIRSAGLSYSKIKYIKDLSSHVKSKQINLNSLNDLQDEEVVEKLVQVKGIGKWTAEMFLIFTLKRPDVFSYGDLGLKNAIKKIYKLTNYDQKSLEKIVSKWSPYKSTAALILWRSLDNR